MLSQNGQVGDLSILDYGESLVSDDEEPDYGLVDSLDDESETERGSPAPFDDIEPEEEKTNAHN